MPRRPAQLANLSLLKLHWYLGMGVFCWVFRWQTRKCLPSDFGRSAFPMQTNLADIPAFTEQLNISKWHGNDKSHDPGCKLFVELGYSFIHSILNARPFLLWLSFLFNCCAFFIHSCKENVSEDKSEILLTVSQHSCLMIKRVSSTLVRPATPVWNSLMSESVIWGWFIKDLCQETIKTPGEGLCRWTDVIMPGMYM